MKVKIGDTIKHSLFGGQKLIGKITEIQICRRGEKEGRSVKTADTEKHHGVVDIDNGHWCYFDQVITVIK